MMKAQREVLGQDQAQLIAKALA
ncbi:MAG: hypothetical protein QOK09_3472, partial [Mycobacterium sp.]|nr:hypothetical protein [Mycobacterium sp.]